VARTDRGRRRGRLDQPLLPRRTLRPQPGPDFFGRLAERIARFIGTAQFLVVQSAFIVAWLLVNTLAPDELRFDAYPFQFLTLMLSLQAAYAAPLILLAQNRQDDRDRANLAQDRDQYRLQREETEFIARELASLRLAVGEVVTRDFLRSELRGALEELAEDEEPADSLIAAERRSHRRGTEY
jgi:uncharacterized membrane protein